LKAIFLKWIFFEGNIIILVTIFFDDKLYKNPAYMFMFNLSLSDLGISIFVNIFTNIGKSI
jgi:hypothetical protein